jgi:hypothetical protein
MTIQEIKSLEAGQYLSEFKGLVKAAFMPSTGKNRFGPWKVQAVILQDENEEEIRVSFWDRKLDMRDLKDSEITVTADKDKDIEAIDYTNEKEGTVERQIKVAKTAIVDEVLSGAEGKTVSGNTGNSKESHSREKHVYDDEAKRKSFERQKALEFAVQFAKSEEEVIGLAESFLRFIEGGSPAQPGQSEVI